MHAKPGLLVLAFVAASPALAHVSVTPTSVAAGSHVKLTLTVPHGCDGSPTTGLRVAVPAGLADVKPLVHPGWQIAVKKSDQARPSQDGKGLDSSQAVAEIAWTGGPLPDAYADEFALVAKAAGKAGATLTLSVTQVCEKGSAHDEPSVRLTKR